MPSNEATMATLNFTIDEALDILRANGMLPESIRNIKAEQDGLLVTVVGKIEIKVRPGSFSKGVLELKIGSNSWAFKIADTLGNVDDKIDEAIRAFPFIHRENKSLFIDLNSALQSKVKGIQVKDFEFRDGLVKIGF
jgi:hypothetical protein